MGCGGASFRGQSEMYPPSLLARLAVVTISFQHASNEVFLPHVKIMLNANADVALKLQL
jgi:hypothetical protein